jgi:hypothetical protein
MKQSSWCKYDKVIKFIWDWWEMYNVGNYYKINVLKEKSMKWIFYI